MLSYNTEIFNILECRVDAGDLEGYYGGMFSPDKTKFIARTYVRLDPARAHEYNDMSDIGYTVMGADFEKTKVYVDERSYQTKPLVDCIRESIYDAYAINFCGVWYEEKWFISDSLE